MKKAWFLIASLALTSCATLNPAPSLPPVVAGTHAVSATTAMNVWFAAHPQWGMNARIALASPTNGGSGRLDWQQTQHGYTATITAPITRQTWRLTWDGTVAQIDGVKGGPIRGTDPQQLLQQVTGWTIPLNDLQNWLQAKPTHASDIQRDLASGLIQSFKSAPWTVTYDEWSPSLNSQPLLPKRISAVLDAKTRVRLNIDSWQGLATE